MSLTLTLERGGGEVSGSGTNIELDGTIAGGAIESVEMYGDTEQTTYSGKNLVYTVPTTDGGLTWTYDSSTGTGTVKGTATRSYSIAGRISDLSLPSGNYTISIQNSIGRAIGVGIRIGGSRTAKYISAGDTTNTFAAEGTITDLDVCMTGLVTNTYYEFTYKLQLETGSTPTSFEPYVGGTASPNPDYPQEVKTVTGEQTITVSNGQGESQAYPINLGKNLFDGSFELGGIDINTGANDGLQDRVRTIGYTAVMPNTTYTISGVRGSRVAIFYDGSKTYLGYVIVDSQTTQGTFTTPNGTAYIRWYVIQTETNIDEQLERGSTATTYAPYFTPIELCKIGTYQDYIYKSGDDWYVHKETGLLDLSGSTSWWLSGEQTADVTQVAVWVGAIAKTDAESAGYSNILGVETITEWGVRKPNFSVFSGNNYYVRISSSLATTAEQWQSYLSTHTMLVYYVLRTPTDTQITNSALIAQLDALNEATTYDGTTVITVSSENLAGSLEVTAAASIAKTYTEVEIGSPFTITDVEGKSSNTTLDGNVYVDWAYNKKQYSFDLFNLTPQDYADIRAFYDYQFNNSAFPTITVPELNIDKLPVYMEISSRNIINQCLLTDKLTIKFRETVQP